MKKLLFLAAVAVLTIASCTKNEVIETPENGKAINFGTYVGNPQTRGAVTDITTLGGVANDATTAKSGTGFGVNAVLNTTSTNVNTPNFMYNQEVKGSSVLYTPEGASEQTPKYTWTYAPIKYWPTNGTDKISFYAWAPWGSSNGVTVKGNDADAKTLDFAITKTAKNMVDFVTANAIDQVYGTGSGQNSTGLVDFTFKHELTRLRFTATTSVSTDETIIVVKSATLVKGNSQIYLKGGYTFGNTQGAAGTWVPVAIGENDDNTITTADIWGTTTEATPFGANTTYKTTNPYVGKDGSTALFAANEYLFLIPVATTGTTADANMVEFTYDIITNDPNLNDGYSISSATKKVALPKEILKQGVAYNVVFNFAVDQILVGEVKVEDWTPSSNPEQSNNPAVGVPSM